MNDNAGTRREWRRFHMKCLYHALRPHLRMGTLDGQSLIRFTRHALEHTPHLRAAWLISVNRWRARARADVLYALGATTTWLLAAAAILLAHESFGSLVARLARHPVPLGLAAGFVAASLTARRRALIKSETPRSWLAAVPVAPLVARAETVAITTAPVLRASAAVTLLFVTAATAELLVRAPMATVTAAYGALMAGLGLGTLVSYLIPLARPEVLPPGSRYVPKSAARRARPLEPSLAPLGIWAVRHVFASARPDAVARATIPILVLMPLGTFADAAMLVLAIAAVSAATLMFIGAAFTVYTRSKTWLLPLPVRGAALARYVVLRPLAAAGFAAVTLAWLLWVFHTYAGKP